jgi:hypothetical protein
MYKATKKLANYFSQYGLKTKIELGTNKDRQIILVKSKGCPILAKIHIWYDKEKVKFQLNGKGVDEKVRGTRSLKALERRLRHAGML